LFNGKFRSKKGWTSNKLFEILWGKYLKPKVTVGKILVQIYDGVLVEIFIFGWNFTFWQNFQFLKKISIFDRNFNFWQNFQFLIEISIFDRNFNFWQKSYFFTENSIFDGNLNFWQKFQSLAEISIYVTGKNSTF